MVRARKNVKGFKQIMKTKWMTFREQWAMLAGRPIEKILTGLYSNKELHMLAYT